MTEAKRLTLTYLNIRQSIVILISKLVTIDLLLAVIFISFNFLLIQGEEFVYGLSLNFLLFLVIFGLIGLFKIFLTIYVVLKWLVEYYEITPEYIAHKHGIFFKKQEMYRLDLVRRMDVQESLLGEIFNFGTITLYDMRLNKFLDLYLIHNSRRYAKVLKTILPNLEVREDKVWTPIPMSEDIAPVEKENGKE